MQGSERHYRSADERHYVFKEDTAKGYELNSANDEGRDVFQRDVECNLNIRSSTATGILKTLEKNGYIERASVPSDARLKKLVLTKKSYDMFEQIYPFIKAVNAKITEGLTEEEIEQFYCIAEKLKRNIDKISKN